jgi:hypothetical protein
MGAAALCQSSCPGLAVPGAEIREEMSKKYL